MFSIAITVKVGHAAPKRALAHRLNDEYLGSVRLSRAFQARRKADPTPSSAWGAMFDGEKSLAAPAWKAAQYGIDS